MGSVTWEKALGGTHLYLLSCEGSRQMNYSWYRGVVWPFALRLKLSFLRCRISKKRKTKEYFRAGCLQEGEATGLSGEVKGFVLQGSSANTGSKQFKTAGGSVWNWPDSLGHLLSQEHLISKDCWEKTIRTTELQNKFKIWRNCLCIRDGAVASD